MSRSQLHRAFRLSKSRCGLPLLSRRWLAYPTEPLTQPIEVAPLRDPALHQPAPGLAGLASQDAGTRVTQLENGLRVASQEAYGQYSTIGGTLAWVE